MGNVSTRDEGFSIAEAAKLSGLTVTMVNYLCREGLIRASAAPGRGRGKPRLFAFGDVVILRAMTALLKAGVSVGRLKASLVGLRTHHQKITPTSLPARRLACDGRNVYLWRNKYALEELVSGQMAFVFVLELSTLQEEVVAAASRMRRRA